MATSATVRPSAAMLPGRMLEKTSIETLSIAYEPAVLEALRRASQAAFDADHAPVFGILLGQRSRYGASVTAWLPAGAYAMRDAGLARALELARLEYPTEQVIGWYRSKHHGEARLTLEELAAVGALITNPLSLVLRPSSQRPLRVAAYLPHPNTALAAERPFQEFFVHADQAAPAGTELVPFLSALPEEPQLTARPARGRFRDSVERLRWAFPAGLLVLVALAALGTARVQGDDPSAPREILPTVTVVKAAAMPAPLRVAEIGKQWQLQWTPALAADRVTLSVVRDGQQQMLSLDPSQYAAGVYSLPAMAAADDVEIQLRAQKGDQAPIEIRARIVGSATTLPLSLTPTRESAELSKVKAELDAERARRQRLMEMYDAQNQGR